MEKFILYGAGRGGLEALKEIGKENVIFFVDGSKEGDIEGIPIIKPDQLPEHYDNGTTIVIAIFIPRLAIEIATKLKQMGIEQYMLFDEAINHVRGLRTLADGKVLINLGSGDWECEGWTNLDYSNEWYSQAHKGHSFKEYDIRHDDIPYDNNTVDAIYCSHVIEHIEDEHDEKMLKECHRVLKPGGVLRIACPDAEFLYNMSKLGKDWWVWRKSWCADFDVNWDSLRPVDLLVREVATPRMKGFGYLEEEFPDYNNEFENMSMEEFLSYITGGLSFDVEHVGDHINYWTYEKLKNRLKEAGFDIVVRSRYAGSVSPYMKLRSVFDITEPGMSLYVEAAK